MMINQRDAIAGAKSDTQCHKYVTHYLFVFLLTCLMNCAGRNSSDPAEFHPPDPAVAKAEDAVAEYTLQAGDVIDIKFFYNPELNERVTIRPDGKLSFQLVDEIKVAGMASSELRRVLTEKYSRILRQPEIAVIVREFAGQKVYVGGEVVSPKAIPLSAEMTALQAILNAGGFRETARPGSVILISKGPKNKPLARSVDLSRVITGESPEDDVLLKPFDVIYVPKTFIAEVNKFVEQYIKNIIPGQLTGGFSYTIQSGTVQTVPAK